MDEHEVAANMRSRPLPHPTLAHTSHQDGFVCVDELNEHEVAANANRIMQFAKAMLRESRPVGCHTSPHTVPSHFSDACMQTQFTCIEARSMRAMYMH